MSHFFSLKKNAREREQEETCNALDQMKDVRTSILSFHEYVNKPIILIIEFGEKNMDLYTYYLYNDRIKFENNVDCIRAEFQVSD